MTNDENGLYELSRDLNLSLLSVNNFYDSVWKKIKLDYFLGMLEILKVFRVTSKVDIVYSAKDIKTCIDYGI